MKQQTLKDIRNYVKNPRSAHEGPDVNYRGALSFEGAKSRTKQSEAAACDINEIMKRYEATGFLPDNDGRRPEFGDFSTMETFQEALGIVSQAQSAFMSLNAEVRARFQNDPAKFLDLVEKARTSKEAGDELIRLGLASVREEDSSKILKDIRENTKAKPVKTKEKPDSGVSNDE